MRNEFVTIILPALFISYGVIILLCAFIELTKLKKNKKHSLKRIRSIGFKEVRNKGKNRMMKRTLGEYHSCPGLTLFWKLRRKKDRGIEYPIFLTRFIYIYNGDG